MKNMKENNQKWIESLKAKFEEQKKLWQESSANSHQKMIQQVQVKHFARFLEKGLPSNKDPFWKFTNINRVLKNIFSSEYDSDIVPVAFANEKPQNLFSFPTSHKIHFHNGILQKNSLNTLPTGVNVLTWDTFNPDFPSWSWINYSLKRTGDGLHHLAGALPSNGYALYARALHHYKGKNNSQSSKNTEPVLHIHFSFDESAFSNKDSLLHKTKLRKKDDFQSSEKQNSSSQEKTNLFLHPKIWNFKNFIFLEEGAKITLIESFSIQNNSSSKQNSFSLKNHQAFVSKTLINCTTDVKVSSKSHLKWLCVDQGTPHSSYLNQAHCDMEESARMDRLNFSLGSLLSREDVQVHQTGEKVQSALLSLALLKGKAVKNQRYYIRHLKKQGYSRQLCRGVLNDHSKNIFHGKIYMSADSAQTDSVQSAKNLLLSSTADSYTQPELEIHCGDVKARHGATAGHLDKDELFYLQSRGLDQKTALEFLMMSHIKDVLSQFPEKSLVENLTEKIQNNKNLYLNL